MILVNSLLAAVVVGALSLAGALSLLLNDKILKKIIIYLVSFAAGALLAGALFHLLPEALEKTDSVLVFSYVIIGFCLFFILERFLRWRHCHENVCQTHEHLGWINLVGDGLHNLIDGMILYAAFMVSPALGIVVTLTIILHEIPQELGDFGVLIYSGFSKLKAIGYNLLSAAMGIVGVLIAYLLNIAGNGSVETFIIPFAAGGFLYIAASDLIPELHKNNNRFKSILSFIIFVIALIFMFWIKIFFEK